MQKRCIFLASRFAYSEVQYPALKGYLYDPTKNFFPNHKVVVPPFGACTLESLFHPAPMPRRRGSDGLVKCIGSWRWLAVVLPQDSASFVGPY